MELVETKLRFIFLEIVVKRKSLTLIVLGLILTSCGLLDKFKTPEDQNASSENIPSSGPTAEAASSPNADAEFDVFSNDEVAPVFAEEVAPAVPVTPEVQQEVIPEVKDEPVMAEQTEKKIKLYKVKKGETLMQIAFKLYGDISRWKDLKRMNEEKVSRNTKLTENLTLKYEAPETEFVWNPAGEPYLINQGETLGVISNNVYQTPKKWKSLWENNRPLIKNPNVIYAGFTLYYIKDANLANYVQPKPVEKNLEADSSIEKIEVANELIKADADTSTRDTASDTENTTF
jgi:LysM repeat protein